MAPRHLLAPLLLAALAAAPLAPPLRRPHAFELFVLRVGGNHVVLPIFLLHDGRDANGALQILKLDPAYGQHHDLQYLVGNRLEGVAWCQRAHKVPCIPDPSHTGWIDDDCRLWQLPGAALDDPSDRYSFHYESELRH